MKGEAIMERRDFVTAAAWTALSASRVLSANDRVIVVATCMISTRSALRKTWPPATRKR